MVSVDLGGINHRAFAAAVAVVPRDSGGGCNNVVVGSTKAEEAVTSIPHTKERNSDDEKFMLDGFLYGLVVENRGTNGKFDDCE
jgi:hypothetical protein